MTKIYNTVDFINKAIEIHGEKYDYSKTVYVKSKQGVIITCPKHGDFTQPPNRHISLKSGCKQCGLDRRVGIRTSTVDCFIEKANSVHKNKYKYHAVKYKNNHTKVDIFCEKHGFFSQTPSAHIHQGQGCRGCSSDLQSERQRNTQEEFLISASLVHGDRYDYSKTRYKKRDRKIEIVCKEHGVFTQSPGNHIYSTSGCPKCGDLLKGWSRTAFEACCNKSAAGKATLYLIECKSSDGDEVFYKIGITSTSISKRFKYRMPYSYKVLNSFEGQAKSVYNLEKVFLEINRLHKYQPKKEFGGWTECFDFIADDTHRLFEVIKSGKEMDDSM